MAVSNPSNTERIYTLVVVGLPKQKPNYAQTETTIGRYVAKDEQHG